MEEWKQYRLGDIISISSGLAYKGEHLGKGDSFLLGMGCVSYTEQFLEKGMRKYDGAYDERYSLKAGDIVLATRQQSDNLPILGMPAIIPQKFHNQKMVFGTNLYKVNLNSPDFSNSFLYWLLKTPNYIHHIKSCQTGTTVRMITKANIEDYTFFCPEKSEREKICKFLWNIENKIALNRRINDNLEQQAQALFKSWFVDFEPFKNGKFVESEIGMIPEGWKVGNLLDVAELSDSKRKPLSAMERSNMNKVYPYYGATSIMDYVDDYLFDGIYLLMGEDGSVMTENGFPYLQYVSGKFWVNNHAHIMQGKNAFTTEMLHCLLFRKNISEFVTGAVQAKISQNNMKRIKLAIAPANVLDSFSKLLDSIYSQIRQKKKESDVLCKKRDLLLPKLMSGKIKINDLNS